MALPVTIPNAFANATASIPLSQLDTNFNTLANAVNGISDGSETLANVTATVGNITTVNATTVDTTNIEVTNIKAKDGTAAVVLTDSTGAIAVSTPLTANGGVVFNEAGANVDFRVEGETDANLLFVDASADRVGIGTNAPASVRLTLNAASGSANGIEIQNSGDSNRGGRIWASGSGASGNFNVASTSSGYGITFNTDVSTERMRIETGGDVLVGSTSNLGSGFRVAITNAGGSSLGVKTGTGGFAYAGYNSGGTLTFRVLDTGDVANTNNSYGAISDVKLKENIVDATPKLEKLNQIRIVNYNLIGSEQKQLGVIAQELEQIFPGMVEETPDRDQEGNGLGTTTKAVKYSVFVPMLIKALQEATTEINALKARLDAANL